MIFFLRRVEVHRYGIDQQKVRLRTQFFQCQLHRQPAGFGDVDAIDCGGVDLGHRPSQRALPNLDCQPFAGNGAELFRIFKPIDWVVGIQNAGAGYNAAEQSAAAHFVDAGHPPRTVTPSRLLEIHRAVQLLQPTHFFRRRAASILALCCRWFSVFAAHAFSFAS